jgi:N,N'-diacetyllegionaminate synthase
MSAPAPAPRTVVIAEIGVNHNGDVALAKQLISAAHDAGADYAKFQTFSAEALVTSDAGVAAYQQPAARGGTQQDMLRGLELTHDDFRELKTFSESLGIGFLTTAHDFGSLDFVLSLHLDYIKIPSGDLTNRPLLERVAREGTKIILSTGMGSFDEVGQAVEALEESGMKRQMVTVLQCTTNYPAPLEEANLRAMVSMGEQLAVGIGYSDHTDGAVAAVAAVALGAHIIERHLTLDRSMPGPDHAASPNPSEFAEMVRSIRAVEMALGSDVKAPGPTEAPNRDIVRKSLVALTPIGAGDEFTSHNVGVKRPGTGISPMRWHEVLGAKAHRSFQIDELIDLP